MTVTQYLLAALMFYAVVVVNTIHAETVGGEEAGSPWGYVGLGVLAIFWPLVIFGHLALQIVKIARWVRAKG